MALLDGQECGKAKFDSLNADIQGQISYVYKIIHSVPDYANMKAFVEGLEKPRKSPKEKTEISLTFRWISTGFF